MQISSQNTTPAAPDPSSTASAQTSSTTGFWALFANANFPEPSWSSVAGPAPAAESATASASTQPISGPTGFEALFSNPSFPALSQPDDSMQQNLIPQGDLYDSSTL